MLYVHRNFGGPHGPAKAKVIKCTILSCCHIWQQPFRFSEIRVTSCQNSQETKSDINKTYFPTGKTRYNRRIITQPRPKKKLLKIPATKGHQVLHLTTKLNHSQHKSKGHNQHFVPLPFLFSQEWVQD